MGTRAGVGAATPGHVLVASRGGLEVRSEPGAGERSGTPVYGRRAVSNVGGTGAQQDRAAWRGLRAASRAPGWARCVGAHAAGVCAGGKCGGECMKPVIY